MALADLAYAEGEDLGLVGSELAQDKARNLRRRADPCHEGRRARVIEQVAKGSGIPGWVEQSRVQLGKLLGMLGRGPEDADMLVIDGAHNATARLRDLSACGLTSGDRR